MSARTPWDEPSGVEPDAASGRLRAVTTSARPNSVVRSRAALYLATSYADYTPQFHAAISRRIFTPRLRAPEIADRCS
jgi:hypothetical protein